MTLRDLLQQNRQAIVQRWLDYALSVYAPDATNFFRSERDRFANPVGHSLRTGTEAIFDSLTSAMDPEDVCARLEEIVKARAIQDLTPSEAVAFVFSLKRAIRTELGERLADPSIAREMVEIEAEIDQVALFAFDIYCRFRDKVSELRINEVKRNVAAVMKRIGVETEPAAAEGAEGGESMRGGTP